MEAETLEMMEEAAEQQANGASVLTPSVQKKLELDQLYAMALSGLLPRSRELKSWEPARLDERHLQAVVMRAAGLQQGYIAKCLGWTEPWTSIVLNHPDAQYLLSKIIGYASDNVLDIQNRIKGVAGEALDKIVEVMRTTSDHRLASTNAFELLKMAGYGAVEKKQIEHQVSVPKQSMDLLSAALSESNQIAVIESQYRMVPGSTDSEVPVVPENSGSAGAVVPPSSEVQDPTLQERVA